MGCLAKLLYALLSATSITDASSTTSSTAPLRGCSHHARANKFMALQTQTRHQVDPLALDVSAPSAPSSTSSSTAPPRCGPRPARANEFTIFKTPSLPSDTPTVRPPMNSLARATPALCFRLPHHPPLLPAPHFGV
ncbi:hypothetical protein T492DRAFT_1100388, partial [Pavlovales sp. CCMP2436]